MKVGIVGGGITGLSCAYYLGKAGIEATVFDATPGGCMGTVRRDGCILETGPESWLAAKPHAEQLIREVGLADELQGSNDSQRRTFILRHGRFCTLPEGLQMVVPTKILPIIETPLFSWGTKIRMGLEMFRSPKTLPDRSVTEFIADHYGREAVEYLAEPLLAGVYGGSPEALSAASVLPKFVEYEQKYGSVSVGSLRDRKSFPKPQPGAPKQSIFKGMRSGMGTLIDNLAGRTTVVRHKVESLAPSGAAWSLYVNGEWLHFDHVILACRANDATNLMAPVDGTAADLLASIPFTGSSVWTFCYRRSEIANKLDAFGFLVPRAERRVIMACTFLNTKWEGRVPDDKAVIRCFSGNPDSSREEVEEDLRRLMGIKAEPLFVLDHRWPGSMPQYTVGHTARMDALEARMRDIPALWLAGNSYRGLGIPDCVRSAREVTQAIAAELTA